MKYYLDITLLPDAEISLGFLWQKVYQQIHIALVDNKISENQSAIAVCFPKYGDQLFPLGDKIRLFANTQEQFEVLNIARWLNRLTDYIHFTSVKAVPLSTQQFVYVKRKQFDTNIERMARRRAKRKNESFEQALSYLRAFKDKNSDLPFINLESLSGKSKFRLFVEQRMVNVPLIGQFNCYGLGNGKSGEVATLPWF